MPTVAQIEQFKRKAKAQGFSEIQIANEVARKIKADAGANGSGFTTTEPTQTKQTKEKGFFAQVGETLIRPLVDYGKFVGESIYQGGRALTSDITKVGGMNKDLDKLIKQNQDVLKRAKAAKDPEEKKRLLQESRDISAQIEGVGTRADAVGKMKPTALLEEKDIATRGQIIKKGVKATAGAASFAIPAGATIKTGAALGAVSGALYGLSEGEDFSLDNILKGAAGGAVAGAVVPTAKALFGKARSGFKSLAATKAGAKEKLSDLAAKRINKASPTVWRKGLEEHGMDINQLTKKYFPEGGSYDDLLGGLKEKGTGGKLGEVMTKAEKAIQKQLKLASKDTKIPVDDVVKELEKEARNLGKLPGNENNIAAMKEFIKNFKNQYKKGMSPQRMLEAKRIADSKFGAAVVDEQTGSAIAQSQKMIANAMRAKLKKLFPEIAEALTTESEVYTLQPVMNHARAIFNTGGSEIRLGSLRGSIAELINPLNLLDNYLSDPKRASKFLKVASKEVGEEVIAEAQKSGRSLFSSIAEILGRAGASDVAIGQEQQDLADQTSATDSEQQIADEMGQDTSIDTTISEQKPSNIFGGMSKQEFLQNAFMQGANNKQLDELEKIYDRLVPEAKESDKKISATAQNQINLAEAGLKGLKDAQTIFDEDPTIVYKGAITAGLFSRKFEAALNRAIEGVLRARSGAAVPESEVKKYRSIYGPQIGDSTAVAKYKLRALQQDLEGIISGNTGADYVPDTTTQ